MVEDRKLKTLIEDITLLENYNKELFSFTPLPLFFVNPMGTVLEINPAFTTVTGYDTYDIVGEPVFKLFPEEDVKKIIEETMKKNLVDNRESAIFSKEGKKIPISIFARSRKIFEEESNGVFFSFFDLTEVKKKEEELKEKLEEMEKFRKLVVGRELKMVELKEKIRKLKQKQA